MEYKVLRARNPKFVSADGSVDLEVEFKHLRGTWVPFTASANDSAEYGRALHAQAMKGEYGPVSRATRPAN